MFEREKFRQLNIFKACIKEVMKMDGLSDDTMVDLQERLDVIEEELNEVWVS